MKNLINSITPREREILRLIAFEFNSKEIASQLCISEETVKTHRKNMMLKVQAKNTAGLIFKSILQDVFSLDMLKEIK